MRRGDTSNLRIQLKRKTKALLSTLDLKKLLLMNIPYIFVFLFADRASCLYRLSPGADIGEKLLYAMAHAEQILGFLPSFYFTDLLVGVGSSMVLKILVVTGQKMQRNTGRVWSMVPPDGGQRKTSSRLWRMIFG